MQVQPMPKPKIKKHKRKKHPPLFPLGYCWGCWLKYGEYRMQNLERHHIYGGNPDRQHSDDYGLYVDLCKFECHEEVTREKNQWLIDQIQQEGQRRFESVHGKEEFKRVFGRNYL